MNAGHAPNVTVLRADLARPEHQHAVVRLLDAYARDPMGGGAGLDEQVKRRLIPGLEAHGKAVVLLAMSGVEAVGIAVCFEGFSTFAARPLLNVHDLAVLPEHRGRGVGTALLEAVAAHARERGCCKVTLEVRVDNAAAQSLYRRHGFSAGGAEHWFWKRPLE